MAHEAMVRHTCRQVEAWLRRSGGRADRGASWAIDGAAPPEFICRFSPPGRCGAQVAGDLGARLSAALGAAAHDGHDGLGGRDGLPSHDVLLAAIGTDCPELSPAILEGAFEALATHDLVLGPAEDGGYYLIGLRQPAGGHLESLFETLFQGMPWGTSRVLEETQRRAATLGCSVFLLPTLPDVDEPADLPVWERVQRIEEGKRVAAEGPPPGLSVIVPTLEEGPRIGDLVRRLRRSGSEVVVADGGSRDGTRAAAAEAGAIVVVAPRGRGSQLNAGASEARGRALLFLHADTSLPPDFGDLVLRTLADESVALGAFRLVIDAPGLRFRFLERAVRWRCALLGAPYGDQALFLRRETFVALGGFAPWPLLEDLDLVRRARRIGRLSLLTAPATTSARRWERGGFLRTTVANAGCLLGYACGISPSRLAGWRERVTARRTGPAAR